MVSGSPPSKSLDSYLQLRELVEQGLYEKAANYAAKWRSTESEESKTLRLLISARVAIKTLGKIGDDVFQSLDPGQTSDPFLKSELYFTRGLSLFHSGEFSRGVLEFQYARDGYRKLERAERELLSAYNVYSGGVNARTLTDPIECLAELRDLERLASKAKNKKLLGIIFREKSDHYQALGKFLAAAESAEQSVNMLALYGAKSDFHLALIQLADVELDRKNPEAALRTLDKMIPPLDQRLEYSFEMVKARLANKEDFPAPEKGIFSDERKWKRNFNAAARAQTSALSWNVAEQLLSFDSVSLQAPLKIKNASLEGKLLKTLLAGPMGKSRLAESLWPEHCGKTHLDNRLHRLLSRFNQKTSGLIQFDGQRYQLSTRVEVTEK